jgi:hypothetical protein
MPNSQIADEFKGAGLTPQQLLAAAPLGISSAWVPTPSAPIRLAAALTAITSGSAQVTIDGSDDGVNSTVTHGTFTLDTVGERVVSPATNFNSAYIRLTVLSGTGATVNAWMGI